jgi:hypothetical protein
MTAAMLNSSLAWRTAAFFKELSSQANPRQLTPHGAFFAQ